MFRNKLSYYHGTSQMIWDEIKKQEKIVPSHIKKVGDYWITKGAYFVCENPYIALWYAHVASLRDNSDPVVLKIEYEVDRDKKGEILNLLTSDGHKALSIAHEMYKEKIGLADPTMDGENLDSLSLQLLMTHTSLKGVIAAFQEGLSFQGMILQSRYQNKHVPQQKGFSPGDHVEICFYPELELKETPVLVKSKKELLDEVEPSCKIWQLVCEGLTEPLNDGKFKNNLKSFLQS